MNKYAALLQQLAGLKDEKKALDANAEATVEQVTALTAKINAVAAEIAAWDALKEAEASLPGTPASHAGSQLTVRDRAEDDPARGFRSHRDFLLAAMTNAGTRDRGQIADARLRPLAVLDKEDRAAGGEIAFMLPEAFTPPSLLAAVGSDEQGGYADRYGGFAVPTSTLPGLLQLGAEADPSAGRTQAIPMATPTVEINARTDKNHTTSVSGGFTVTRRPETVAAAASRMEMEKVVLKASSLFGLAYATEEILTDSPISFAAIIASGFQSQFAHHMLSEKLRGGGGNEYLGILNSPALVTVAAEGGQSADTIKAENVINMRARCWGYGDAIWLANHDTFPQLIKAAILIEGAAGGGLVNVYQPSLKEDRPDMLLGRPIFYSEYPSTLGDVGDLMLINWSQFLEGLYQPLQSAESVHVRFANHERAFKFWLRNAGAGWWRSALTAHKGANTLSPFVTLAAR
jgi:HK97 family phage major capsid protein